MYVYFESPLRYTYTFLYRLYNDKYILGSKRINASLAWSEALTTSVLMLPYVYNNTQITYACTYYRVSSAKLWAKSCQPFIWDNSGSVLDLEARLY